MKELDEIENEHESMQHSISKLKKEITYLEAQYLALLARAKDVQVKNNFFRRSMRILVIGYFNIAMKLYNGRKNAKKQLSLEIIVTPTAVHLSLLTSLLSEYIPI